MATARQRPSAEEIRRTVEQARRESHRRVAERGERVREVIARTDRIQERLRRRATSG